MSVFVQHPEMVAGYCMILLLLLMLQMYCTGRFQNCGIESFYMLVNLNSLTDSSDF